MKSHLIKWLLVSMKWFSIRMAFDEVFGRSYNSQNTEPQIRINGSKIVTAKLGNLFFAPP
jgi:hypothetical protein